jgi:hypothetical protein
MTDYKSLLASKTFWGAAVAVLGSVLNLLGYNFAQADQQLLIEFISNIAIAGGGVFAMYGRVKATKKIG